MAENKGVMVFCEQANGKLAAIAAEGLGIGRQLADGLGQELSGVIMGSGTGDLAAQAISLGASRVFLLDDPALKDYRADAFLQAAGKVINQATPSVIIMGQTSLGRDLAPRLAFRLGTTATLDCIELAIDPASKKLLQTKPVYGGNARAVYTSDTMPQVATIRTKAMAPAMPDTSRKGEVVKVDAGLDVSGIRTSVLNRVAQQVEGVKLEDAQAIIVGGRGIGGTEGFKQLEALAKLLKGAVGASRPPCDNGWVPGTLQIGLTGKIVAPDVYIAVAISGSSQHMSGCSGSKTIIAINKDPEANIFKEARFGVVGDWKKVLPAFTNKVRELLAG